MIAAIVCDPVTIGQIKAHGEGRIRRHGVKLIAERAA